NSLFFVSIGMLLDTRITWSLKGQVLVVVAGLILLKIIIIFFTVRLLGFRSEISLLTALGLAQIGEFSFVLASVGRENGFLAGPAFQIFVAASVLTILLTPLLIEFGPGIAGKMFKKISQGKKPESANLEANLLRDQVIIAGFGLNGQNLARVLRETGISYVIIEINPDTFRKTCQAAEPIIFGDVSSPVILREAGIARARALVLAISDPAATRRAVNVARGLNKDLYILVRTRYSSEIEELYSLGANDVIPEEFETSIEIFVRVLEKYHLPRNIINSQVQIIRSERYGILRGARSSSRRLSEKIYDFLEAGVVETFLVSRDSWLVGKTLGEIDLRGKTGVTVIAAVRNEKTHSGPGADFRLKERDIMVLVGDHQAMDKAFGYLETGIGDRLQR
ncbi:MAG: NAD-binding protein, partial [Candidatus Saccharicenans sp.]